MLVPSQQSESQARRSPSTFTQVCLHVRGLWARCLFGSTRNSRGIPKPPGFHPPLPFLWRLPSSIASSPSCFFSGLLALGMNPLTEFLGHFRLNGFYGITGNRFIPPAQLQLLYHSLWCRKNILSFSCFSFDIHACLCVFYALVAWPQRSVHRSTGRMWSSLDTHLSWFMKPLKR